MPEDPKTMEDTGWEMVEETIKGQDYTQRLEIAGGLLYRTVVIAGATTGAAGQVAVALTFVPDDVESP